ncbi:UDP-N-acetylmuramoyl-L-alanine--D-glutamateligase (EC 6.3.2.9), partial [uncultured Gammaproteobacteria bacterium]
CKQPSNSPTIPTAKPCYYPQPVPVLICLMILSIGGGCLRRLLKLF